MVDHDDDLQAAGSAYRASLGDAPPSVTEDAVREFRRAHAPRRRGVDVPRWAVGLAGVFGVLLDTAVLFGGLEHSRQDVAALHLALSIGFLIAAWRPTRYAGGLAPVAAAAAVLLFLPTATDSSVLTSGAVDELSHLPVVVGAAGLLLGRWGRSVEQTPAA